MLDIKLIREKPDTFKEACEKKGVDPKLVDKAIESDEKRRSVIKDLEERKARQNKFSRDIVKLPEGGKKTAIDNMKQLSEEVKSMEDALRAIEKEYTGSLLQLPNPPFINVPVGKDENDNVEIRKWGELPKFDFKPKDHVELGKNLDIIDIPRGVKVSGSRFYFLKGEGVRLEMAVLQYTIDQLVKKGFTPFIVPLLVNYQSMLGTSYFPGGEEQAYEMKHDDLFLIGTSEVSITSYHGEEILKEEDLPKKYCGISPCFRREAGTYGKDTRGLYRVHQFQKVEQVIVCRNDEEESAKMHQMILKNAEDVVQALKLPYRVVDVCTGDMGQGQVYKNDIEAWMPSRGEKGAYGETHSCSTFHEFQARRLNMRYKDKKGKSHFCHTLNNTCIASPRILIPILENYQNEDGSVTVPEVLRAYMGGEDVILHTSSSADTPCT